MRLAVDPPLDPDRYAFAHDVRARFAETDAMGVIHHAAYLPWLEAARAEWLRELGHPYTAQREEGVELAVLEAHVQYRSPARFDDLVRVHVGIGAIARATIQVGYLATIGDRPVLTAVTVHAAVTTEGRPTRMPRWLKELDVMKPD